MQGPPVFLPILIQFGSFSKYPPKIHIYVSFFVKKYKEAWEFFEKRTRFIVYHHHQQMALGIDGKNCCACTHFFMRKK